MDIVAPTPETFSGSIAQPQMPKPFGLPIKGKVLGRIGHLETRLAVSDEEIFAAQRIRYQVFADELGATLPLEAMLSKRDFDQYDPHCDHLLVIDRDIAGSNIEQIVGTYRLMRQDVANSNIGFYSHDEYDVESLIARHPEKQFLELGRSCVMPKYRMRRSIELLWQGIWAYCLQNNIDVMFGCASFHGAVPAAHAQSLSFLYHFANVHDEWGISPRGNAQHLMDLMPREAVNPKQALSDMPPLMKGYLRLGAMFSSHAVVDSAFNTTDVLIILPRSKINPRYINHYGADANRFTAS